MRHPLALVAALLAAGPALAPAQTGTIALLDFENKAGSGPTADLAAGVTPAQIANRGAFFLARGLTGDGQFRLIDRRDFVRQIEAMRPTDDGRPTAARPSFLHAAQTLNADYVVRGELLSLSSTSTRIDQGGHQVAMRDLNLRVGLSALDAVDGRVVAMADAAVARRFRQTAGVRTELGEDDLVGLLEEAVNKAVPSLAEKLGAVEEARAARPRVRLTVTSTESPALVELNGVLIGSTPLEDFQVYAGDHVITVGKAGHRDVTKRILIDRDMAIEFPLFRAELTAEEIKQIVEGWRVDALIGVQPSVVIRHLGGD